MDVRVRSIDRILLHARFAKPPFGTGLGPGFRPTGRIRRSPAAGGLLLEKMLYPPELLRDKMAG